MSAKTEINALAELESELRFTLTDIRGECCEASYEAVEKALRIVAEIARLRALVKELADMLDDNPCFDCDSCGESCECCSDRKNIRALVTKAREECK